MELTQIERLENTIANKGYGPVYNEDELIKIMYLIDNHSYGLKEILEDNYMLDDTQLYHYDNYVDLAEDFINEGLFGTIPDSLIGYIDYEAIGRDLQYDYDLFEVDNEIYILRKD